MRAFFGIGYRTIKTAIGAGLAVFIAQQLNLEFYVSAGIITILCISVTKKDSLHASWQRIIACVVGLFYASVIFEFIGYHPLSLTLLLLIFIPTMVAIRARLGIVTSAVIMFHLYTVENVTPALILNELALIVIGVGVALLMNLYMPSVELELVKYQVQVEELFSKIWKEYARYLRYQDTDWDGSEITKAARVLDEGKGMALRNVDNHFMRHDDYFYHYFKMREKQFEVIERVLPFVSTLDDSVMQGDRIAFFMDRLSEGIHPGNTAQEFLNELGDLKEELKNTSLPDTRQEFEIRAALHYILHELEQYLVIKRMFKPDPARTRTVSGKKIKRHIEQRKGDKR
ncbi:aromatic acid exporter family protein [Salsuginibacillus kocurii]|uniref:aromatic acid exporter family protein n=1 Tax=Salsuginibacillus kocurii TaxID=427078 RepID=UPI00037FAF1C|nr:aromatic acid exporter family protein [Salsuginibacillus kocurii]